MPLPGQWSTRTKKWLLLWERNQTLRGPHQPLTLRKGQLKSHPPRKGRLLLPPWSASSKVLGRWQEGSVWAKASGKISKKAKLVLIFVLGAFCTSFSFFFCKSHYGVWWVVEALVWSQHMLGVGGSTVFFPSLALNVLPSKAADSHRGGN